MKKIAVLAIAFAWANFVQAQMKSAEIDALANQVLKSFDVPGMAVAVVKDGKVVHSKGYGVRSLLSNKPVDAQTLFGIASNSKAFTCVALAQLVDAGKLSWDDPVQKYIPEFSLQDACATQNFTVRDLVTHRSGLGLGAGDLLFFPEGGNRTVQDVLTALKYQDAVSSFRSKFDYNNNLFIVAGEVIKRISGESWEDYITNHILQPVGFEKSTASYARVKNNPNIIDAHAPVNGRAVRINHDWSEVANPAGGIMSNLEDMSKWAMVVMNNFQLPNGKRLISKAQQQELWNLHTPLPVALNGPYNTHFNGYGLGWFLSDAKGQFQVAHTGGLIGTVTQFTLLPDMGLGIIILTNQQSGLAFTVMTNTIKDSYLGYENRKWLEKYSSRNTAFNASVAKLKDSVFALVKPGRNTSRRQQEFILGTYRDNWMGNMLVEKQRGGLRISFDKSPRLKGDLLPVNDSVYIAKWDDRSYDADAWVIVREEAFGKAQSLHMEALSPSTDFSFDFHDLKMRRVEKDW